MLFDFQAATLEQVADKVFLSWASTAPWAAAAFAVLFVLSAIPSAWLRRAAPAAGSRLVSHWYQQQD